MHCYSYSSQYCHFFSLHYLFFYCYYHYSFRLYFFLIQRLNKDTLNSLQALVNACNSFVDNVVPTLQTDLLPKELQEVFMSFNSMSEKNKYPYPRCFTQKY